MTVYVCFPQGKAKALTLSYDDGIYDDFRLVEILNKNGIKATFNINYGITIGDAGKGGRPRIPADQIMDLYKGHEIATHSYCHPTIARCPKTEPIMNIIKDRQGLEGLTGHIVRGHAYPNGSYSEEVKQILRDCDIAYARVVETTGKFDLPADPYEWKGTCHHKDPRLMDLAKEFVDNKKKQYLKLFYLWGHSYEFSQDDNWEVIEEFCEFMAGREDIWYATNIEIIDYLAAAKQIRYSADSSFAYNPTATSVWVAVDNDNYYELKPGETTWFK